MAVYFSKMAATMIGPIDIGTLTLVSVAQTSRGISDENRLRQRGSGQKRQFCYVSDWCHTITAKLRFDHVIWQ